MAEAQKANNDGIFYKRLALKLATS